MCEREYDPEGQRISRDPRGDLPTLLNTKISRFPSLSELLHRHTAAPFWIPHGEDENWTRTSRQ